MPNIPGLFSIVQGARAQAIRAAQPPMLNIPAVPMQMGGGEVRVAGYDKGIDPAQEWVDGSMGGNTPGAPQTPTANPDNPYINSLIGTGDIDDFASAQAMWNDMSDDMKARVRAYVDHQYSVPGGPGGGGDDGAQYAAIAQRADEFAKQLAFDREREANRQAEMRQSVAAQQQQALTDFAFNQEALRSQRKQLHNDAVTSALNAWTANVGQANIPGIENWRMEGGAASDNIMSNAPVMNFNPLEAYGKQLSEPAQIAAPNIPGISYGAA